MRIPEIRNYFRHHKGLLLLALLCSSFCGLLLGQVVANHAQIEPQINSLTSTEANAATYNNTLVLQISGTGTAAYSLTFNQDFSQAAVLLGNTTLNDEAYVRIFDSAGNLMAEEHATATTTGGFTFADTPRSYTLNLAPGSLIEIHAASARVMSNLTGQEASAFRPRSTTERYEVLTHGLRRSNQSDMMAYDSLYAILKDYLTAQIAAYQSQVAPEVIANKRLDQSNKARIYLAFYALRPEDQAPYQEFISALEAGGSPTLEFHGNTSYPVGTQVNWAELATAFDAEDGDLSAAVEVTGNANLVTPGTYQLSYLVHDSDGNSATLEVTVELVAAVDEPTTFPPIDSVTEDLVAEQTLTATTNIIPTTSSSTGAGNNLENIADTIKNNVPEAEESTNSVDDTGAGSTTTNIDNTGSNADLPRSHDNQGTTSDDYEASNIPVKTIAIIVVSTLAIVVLSKFIRDHYIR